MSDDGTSEADRRFAGFADEFAALANVMRGAASVIRRAGVANADLGPPRTDVRIYKYPLPIADEQSVLVPKGARVLSVQEQDGALCMWAIGDASGLRERRPVYVVGTGNPADHVAQPGVEYVGTAQMGRMVWHVFIGPTPEAIEK